MRELYRYDEHFTYQQQRLLLLQVTLQGEPSLCTKVNVHLIDVPFYILKALTAPQCLLCNMQLVLFDEASI